MRVIALLSFPLFEGVIFTLNMDIFVLQKGHQDLVEIILNI